MQFAALEGQQKKLAAALEDPLTRRAAIPLRSIAISLLCPATRSCPPDNGMGRRHRVSYRPLLSFEFVKTTRTLFPTFLHDRICTEKANRRVVRLGGRGEDLKIKSFDNSLAGAASSCATPVSVTSRVTTALPIRHGAGRQWLRCWSHKINKAREKL